MSELANYSIETDHTVLLAFSDGRHLRVHVGQLPHHLAAPDLAKVRASLKLRRDFIKDHMPKAAMLLLAGGLLALLTLGGKEVARIITTPTSPSAPDSTGIVRSQTLDPGPGATPQGQSLVKRETTVASTVAQNPAVTAKRLTKSARVFTTPVPKVSPVPTPAKSPLPAVIPSTGQIPDSKSGATPPAQEALGDQQATDPATDSATSSQGQAPGDVAAACNSTVDPLFGSTCLD